MNLSEYLVGLAKEETTVMTPFEYRTALSTLGLSQQAAGRWLGVSPKTAQNYATKGPSGPAAKAVGMAVALAGLDRWEMDNGRGEWRPDPRGDWIDYCDLTAAIGLPLAATHPQ